MLTFFRASVDKTKVRYIYYAEYDFVLLNRILLPETQKFIPI
jgi:hypothetical protein